MGGSVRERRRRDELRDRARRRIAAVARPTRSWSDGYAIKDRPAVDDAIGEGMLPSLLLDSTLRTPSMARVGAGRHEARGGDR